MNVNTVGEPTYFYDMCAHCTLDTAGNHVLGCPCAEKCGSTYPEYVRNMKGLLDAHPEWGIEYL